VPVEVYLEVGAKRTFAGALDWPGWCRSAKDADGALEALVDAAPRYAATLRGTRLGYTAARSVDAFEVVERLRGDATTDFGAPSIAPKADRPPLEGAELDRQLRILRACWREFDRSVSAARGRRLATGPRGGGRSLDAIVEHVLGAESGYLRMIAGTPPRDGSGSGPVHDAVVEALERGAIEGIPARGPKGGKRWSARYFVRRAAWHVLDHAWELDDRTA
jgi:hypothetical protein